MKKKAIELRVGPVLSFGFFRTAQLNVEYLLAQRDIGKASTSTKIKRLVPGYTPPFSLENGATFLAARYNFKHALELSMKALFQVGKKDIPKDRVNGIKSGHDLAGLCQCMKSQLVGHSILEKSFIAWEWLIKEYSANDKFNRDDRMNELEKYMFGKNGKVFPYKDIHALTRKDLKIFLRDIVTAKQLFWKMETEHQHIQYCKRFSLDPNQGFSKTIICELPNGRYITKQRPGVKRSTMLE